MKERRLEKYLEEKLVAGTTPVSPGFRMQLMQRIALEQKTVQEDARTARIVKLIISFFLGLSALTAVVAAAIVSASSPASGGPSLLTGIFHYIRAAALDVLRITGVSASPQSAMLVLYVIVLISIYLLADRLFIRTKFKK